MQILSHFTDFTGYVLFIITSFLAGVESTDQCLLNSKVLSWGHNEYKIVFSIIWNMFISKLGCPERKETNSLTSKCRFKSPRIHELCYVLELKISDRCILVSFIPS